MLVARNYQPSNLIRLLPAAVGTPAVPARISGSEAGHAGFSGRDEPWPGVLPKLGMAARPQQWRDHALTETDQQANDLLYLFACQVEWEQRGDPSAAWEVISAARGPHGDKRAHARSLLERSQEVRSQIPEDSPADQEEPETQTMEAGMRTPYGLEIIESCMG